MWFKVDDRFHSHPKASATSLAALGLWAVAGSWSGDHLTDGVVPDHVVPVLSRGASELADELVAAGLWKRIRGGYRFHQWDERNPTKQEVEIERARKADAGRKGGLASAKTRSKRKARASASATAGASGLLPEVPNPRPDPPPSKEGGEGAPRRADALGAGADAPSTVTHPPPMAGAAAKPPDLTAVKARLAAASRKHRAVANRREGRALDELRALTPDVPVPSDPVPNQEDPPSEQETDRA